MIARRRPLLGLVATAAIMFGACSTPAATPAPTAAPATPAPTTAPATPAPTTAPATPAPTTAPASSAAATSAAPSVAASSAAATSAAPASSAAASAGTATLTAHLYQAFTSFYPWSESGTGGDSLAMELQWDYLAAYDEKGNPQMRLADSITASPDAKTWTVKMKPNMVWSDGTPITSADVLFTWSLGANPNQSYNSNYWLNVVGMTDWQKGPDFSKPFTGITAPYDSTIVFQLLQPNAAFEATILNFRNLILPSKQILAAVPNIHTLSQKDIWALPFWQSPTVGEGPYLWQKTETGQFLQFAPNPQQNWRTTAPAFSQVILKPIQDFSVSAAQVQSGDLDYANVNLADLPGLSAAGLQTATAVAPFPIHVDFNVSGASRFQDVKVRQAFMYGCDRASFVANFLQGKGLATDTYFFPDWVPKDGIMSYPFDINKAKSLLDAAKFDYSKPVVWLSWNKDAIDRQSFIEDCQAKMKTIGVNIEIVNGLDVTNKLGQEGQWDLQLYGGYPIVDPDTIRTFATCDAIGKTPGKDSADFPNGHLYKYGGANYSNWCDPAFDKLMNQASQIADQTQRAALYKQAQDIYLSQVPIMIAYRNATSYVWSSKLTGVVPYGDPSQAFLKIDQWSKSS